MCEPGDERGMKLLLSSLRLALENATSETVSWKAVNGRALGVKA
jgi:hypothetical protein